MKPRDPGPDTARVVSALPAQIPVLDAENLPGADDWAVLESLHVVGNDAQDAELQYDRYGSLMLAPAALD